MTFAGAAQLKIFFGNHKAVVTVPQNSKTMRAVSDNGAWYISRQ